MKQKEFLQKSPHSKMIYHMIFTTVLQYNHLTQLSPVRNSIIIEKTIASTTSRLICSPELDERGKSKRVEEKSPCHGFERYIVCIYIYIFKDNDVWQYMMYLYLCINTFKKIYNMYKWLNSHAYYNIYIYVCVYGIITAVITSEGKTRTTE